MPSLRLLPLLLLLAAVVAAVALDLPRELSWSALAARQQGLIQAAEADPPRAVLAYTAAYASVVALSVPAGIPMSVVAGLMFGAVLGSAAAVAGGTLGAILLFLVVRGALRPMLEHRLVWLTARIEPGLRRDGFSYLLAIRLIPVVPFWLTNLAPALVGMKLAPFAAATFLGTIPATVVLASLGAGLRGAFATGQAPGLGVLFDPGVLLPLTGLALLSLLPVAWRHWRRAAGA